MFDEFTVSIDADVEDFTKEQTEQKANKGMDRLDLHLEKVSAVVAIPAEEIKLKTRKRVRAVPR